MAYPVIDLAGFFGGGWRVSRRIVDGAGADLGWFRGGAEFRPESEQACLVYHEQGHLELGSHRGSAFRTLRYRVTGPGQAGVYFDYGDFFHDLDLRGGWWRARHPCRDDLYQGEYEVMGPDRWRLSWTVAGPTKNHTLISVFDRDEGQSRSSTV